MTLLGSFVASGSYAVRLLLCVVVTVGAGGNSKGNGIGGDTASQMHSEVVY